MKKLNIITMGILLACSGMAFSAQRKAGTITKKLASTKSTNYFSVKTTDGKIYKVSKAVGYGNYKVGDKVQIMYVIGGARSGWIIEKIRK